MAELAALPSLPPLAAHVWGWFFDIRATGGVTGMGPARLTRSEIQTWEAETGNSLAFWERRAILDLDAAWMA